MRLNWSFSVLVHIGMIFFLNAQWHICHCITRRCSFACVFAWCWHVWLFVCMKIRISVGSFQFENAHTQRKYWCPILLGIFHAGRKYCELKINILGNFDWKGMLLWDCSNILWLQMKYIAPLLHVIGTMTQSIVTCWTIMTHSHNIYRVTHHNDRPNYNIL